MEVRQFHSRFLPICVCSFMGGVLVGFLMIAKFNLPLYAFMFGYYCKYIIEIICFSIILNYNSKSIYY